jgi:AARP2CN (NUC121) domain
VVFYGYVRGTHMKHNMQVHLIGVGDFAISEISALNDPCAIPDPESSDQKVRLFLSFFIFMQNINLTKHTGPFVILLDTAKERFTLICSSFQCWCCFI